MAASLLALLSQQTPNLQTRKGLILLGLQNDFLSPDGKLPVSSTSSFLDRINELVPSFREYGDVVWVRSHFQENRDVNRDDGVGDSIVAGSAAPVEEHPTKMENDEDGSPSPSKKARMSSEAVDRIATADDLIERIETGHPGLTEVYDEDDELFLTETAKREPCCIPGSFGAEYGTHIKDLVDAKKDMQLIKTYYSAFGSTSLLLTLRSKLITELFICGCSTNLSVFATAMDAARYGIRVTLVEDCLGYRRKNRHDLAIKQLREIMEADVMTSAEVIDVLKNPPPPPETDDEDDEEEEVAIGEDAEGPPPDILEADSDEDVDDFVPAVVRSSTLSGRTLELRNASSTVNRLPEALAAGSGPPSPIEPAEPPSPRSADGTAIDRSRSGDESGQCSGDGTRENQIERWLSRTTGDDGVADESSRRVNAKEPWVDVIDKHWAEQTHNSHRPSGQSSHPGLAALSAVVGLDQATVDKYEVMMEAALPDSTDHGTRLLQSQPLFGEDKAEESAGSRISYDLLPPDLAETIFKELNDEITWQQMHHQTGTVPRLVCCQGTVGDDGTMPVYRHPSDQTLPIQSWTPVVDKVRKAAEQAVGHPLNHALIQLYRGGTDYISEHSDKTLDIVKDSLIVNVSFGAQRVMRLRTKRAAAFYGEDFSLARTTHRVPMPHNSIITMSLDTNAKYLHGINADKRPAVELSETEKAFDGQRISLTFRHIGTFLNQDSSRIWGQGAVGKTKDDANPVINADAAESERLVKAFGTENQSSKVDWDAIYGSGFDVLHLK